jgi:hypothetical protein
MEPFLLSDQGSTRASAYTFSNKSITLKGKTHVVWLDAIAEVKGRTYDHSSKTWSETFHIGTGCDNHTSPAITVDKDGFIRMAYGPHVRGWNEGRFKYAKSAKPNDISEWSIPPANTSNFGYSATYACMIHTPQGEDVIVYRGGDYPLATQFQKTRPKGGWSYAKPLFYQDIAPQYTHYGSIIAATEEGALYAGAHFYNVGKPQDPVKGDKSIMRSYGIAMLCTKDLGETWTSMSGEPVHTPTLYNEKIAVPPLHADMRISGLAINDNGFPVCLILSSEFDNDQVLIVEWNGAQWETSDLGPFLPEERVPTGGSMTMDAQGNVHAAVMAVDREVSSDTPDKVWGHKSSEVFHITKNEEQTTCTQISETDPDTANWLPNISRQELYAPVEKPVILYTHGVKGEGCTPPDRTKVYCIIEPV